MSNDLIKRPNFLHRSKETEEYINHQQKLGVFNRRSGTVLRDSFNTSRKKTIMGFFDAGAITRGADTADQLLYQNPGVALHNPVMEKLPPNAFVTNAWYEVLTTFTSGTDAATLAITIPVDDVNGIVAAVAISDVGNPWDAAVPVQAIQDGAIGNFSNKTTAYRSLGVTTGGGEALTAGLMAVVIEYVQTHS